MRNSGIGGQAVMEGIMMRNKDQYAVAVRRPDQEIEVKTEPYRGIAGGTVLPKIPLIRGVISFVDSLVLGIRTLMYSASFFEEEEDTEAKSKSEKTGKNQKDADGNVEVKATAKSDAKNEKKDDDTGFVILTVVISLAVAITLFMLLPYLLTELIGKVIESSVALGIIEAVVRIVIFLGYLLLISRMKDIQRTFEYHGAEHKCINCIESGLPLNVDNVMKSSRFHKRCGTSFLFLVMIISAILLMFVRPESHLLRLVYRIVLIPVIAGISFEIIRFAGRHDNAFVDIISKPGLWMQKLTTKEPDREEAEVAIAAVEAVFDWKEFLENGKDEKCC